MYKISKRIDAYWSEYPSYMAYLPSAYEFFRIRKYNGLEAAINWFTKKHLTQLD